jgi:hypothetical protein
VVLITDAIVNEGAMMIEFLYALPAIVAMESFSRLNSSTVETEIFEVNTLLICKTEYFLLSLALIFLQ